MMITKTERGQAGVETVLLVPAIVLVVALISASWRIWWARAQVGEAAASGARAASLQGTGRQARDFAQRAATADLQTVGLSCVAMSSEVDVSAFTLPAGHAGTVTVRVGCDVTLGDLLVPGLPGHMHIAAAATEPLDTFKERRP